MLVGMLVTGLRFPHEMKTAAVLLGLFAVGNMIAAAVSADPLTTLRSLSVRIYMTLAWCLFVGLIVTNPERILRTIWLGYLAAAILAVTWAMLEYFGFINFGDWQAGLRAKGPFKDPNVFAPFLIPAAVYALNRVFNRHGLGERILNAAVFGFLAFGVLLSFSRGAWLNFFVACGLFSLLTAACLPTHRDRLRWTLVNAILILATVALIGFATSTKGIADRFMQRAVLTQKYDVAQGGRFYTQKQAIQKIATTPLGVGPGRSDEEFGL
ncbi:MAG: hypothetical protein HKN81_03240, partial [Gammaproteobacteria bacterium]|nr:hypothetical protein [Gammaproteobacteria bacterium]